jgi:RES domain-containing protein
MLEIQAHANIGRILTPHKSVIIDVPDNESIEIHDENTLPDKWNQENSSSARTFGNHWLSETKTALVIVPSVIARLDKNVLINPLHPRKLFGINGSLISTSVEK